MGSMYYLIYLLLILTTPFCVFGDSSIEVIDSSPPQSNLPLNPTPRLAPEQTLAAEHFFNLAEKRLEIIHNVAKWKWNNGAYIRDRSREASILHSLSVKSSSFNLPQEWTLRFLKNVLRASCELQRLDIAEWREERRGHFASAQDLRTELDPKLDNVTEEILIAASKIKPLFCSEDTLALTLFFEEKIEKSLFPKTVLKRFTRPLINLIEEKKS